MSGEAASEARKALNRLRRAVEKSIRELDSLEEAISRAEGSDFPDEEYARVRSRMDEIKAFADEEARRLQQKVLLSGGLEPGRIQRDSQ